MERIYALCLDEWWSVAGAAKKTNQKACHCNQHTTPNKHSLFYLVPEARQQDTKLMNGYIVYINLALSHK